MYGAREGWGIGKSVPSQKFVELREILQTAMSRYKLMAESCSLQ